MNNRDLGLNPEGIPLSPVPSKPRRTVPKLEQSREKPTKPSVKAFSRRDPFDEDQAQRDMARFKVPSTGAVRASRVQAAHSQPRSEEGWDPEQIETAHLASLAETRKRPLERPLTIPGNAPSRETQAAPLDPLDKGKEKVGEPDSSGEDETPLAKRPRMNVEAQHDFVDALFSDTTDRHHTDHFSGGSWINHPGGLSGSGDGDQGGDHPEVAGNEDVGQHGAIPEGVTEQQYAVPGGEADPQTAEGGNEYFDANPVHIDTAGFLNLAGPGVQTINIPSDEEPEQQPGMFRTILTIICFAFICVLRVLFYTCRIST